MTDALIETAPDADTNPGHRIHSDAGSASALVMSAEPLSETPASAPRRIRPDSVWDEARDDYLTGFSAEEVCRRHDLGLSAFWTRAREGGWRRADQPPPPLHDDDLDLDAPREPRDRMLDKAWRRASLALDAGRSTEAMRWMRFHAMLLEAERAEDRDADRRSAEEMRAVTRVARGVEAQAVATLRRLQADERFLKGEANTVQSKNSSDAPPDPDEAGLSRAERRRRLKYRARHPGAADP